MCHHTSKTTQANFPIRYAPMNEHDRTSLRNFFSGFFYDATRIPSSPEKLLADIRHAADTIQHQSHGCYLELEFLNPDELYAIALQYAEDTFPCDVVQRARARWAGNQIP